MKMPLPAVLRPSAVRVVRPRATRAFATRRRAVLLSLFLVAVGAPVGGYLTSNGYQYSSAAIAEVFRDPLSVLSGRSPGARGQGAMFQTKPAKQRLASSRQDGPGGPTERVLPVVRERPAGAPAENLVPPADIAGPPGLPPPPVGQPDPLPQPPVVPPGQPDPPLPPPPPPGGCCVTDNPPPTPGPVPEPATWMMMILGFGLVGSAVRRRNVRLSARRRAAAQG